MNINPILICTVGLPRSGKTTWAKAWGKDNNAPIVNPDSIRIAIHGQRFVAEAEPFVWATAKAMVRALFLAGHSTVILDATSITRKRRDEWRSNYWETAFHHIPTPAAECIRRAKEMRDDEIIPIIDRMASEFESLQADESEALPLGSTGNFPDGAKDEHDEGEIRLAMVADLTNAIVRVDFGKPVTWLGLPEEHARNIGNAMLHQADTLRRFRQNR